MVKIKNKLKEYKRNVGEEKVIDKLGNLIDASCWSSFEKINKKIDDFILEAKINQDTSEVDRLKVKRKEIVHKRIKEMKENIKENYKKELAKQDVGYVCYYCEKELEDRGHTYADLDHILLKKSYSKLTLTPFNLVPSCQACNRTLKGDEDVNRDTNIEITEQNVESCNYTIIHPYLDNKIDYLSLSKYEIWVLNRQNKTNRIKAQKTIDLFELNNERLIEERHREESDQDKLDKIKELKK